MAPEQSVPTLKPTANPTEPTTASRETITMPKTAKGKGKNRP
jgi:hypothetical protein